MNILIILLIRGLHLARSGWKKLCLKRILRKIHKQERIVYILLGKSHRVCDTAEFFRNGTRHIFL